jgi:hypothetical protein
LKIIYRDGKFRYCGQYQNWKRDDFAKALGLETGAGIHATVSARASGLDKRKSNKSLKIEIIEVIKKLDAIEAKNTLLKFLEETKQSNSNLKFLKTRICQPAFQVNRLANTSNRTSTTVSSKSPFCPNQYKATEVGHFVKDASSLGEIDQYTREKLVEDQEEDLEDDDMEEEDLEDDDIEEEGLEDDDIEEEDLEDDQVDVNDKQEDQEEYLLTTSMESQENSNINCRFSLIIYHTIYIDVL